ncbi:polymerase delta-interacting protein 2-like [Lingula anatina]|uniref:Polymerase delta-interacting protein 2-like n=1 Tax=Lingula anatina TaxID=7574 RepID=A0A1S3IPN8_LINAN|nr:polymerase delta-interacting protein 2-like [Lingula anatina]|eukprot:XP_013400177.1 polymerase delta-interacting protein 2-like [Lingula anatina]
MLVKGSMKYIFVWRLIIRIENLGEEELLLEKQDYRVSFVGPDSPLQVRRVLFDKVFYHNSHIKPWLTKERPAIQFNNTIIDSNSSGEIWGTITFKSDKGSILDFKVPKISMESR